MGEDWISNLPEELMHHILSSVPAKCAMSTCTLSKRWKYISNSIPTLDFREWRTEERFSEEEMLETKSFKNFLDTVLFLHEKPNIQKFYLDLDDNFDESQVYRWISTIIKRKVQEFYLYMNYSCTSSVFPLSLFTCDSLTLLDLRFELDVVGDIIIPETVYFPKLKILRLESLAFLDEITSTRNFFSNCPTLEELSMTCCHLFERLCIANPSVKHLIITSCDLSESTVEICAPNLLTISYKGEPAADFVLGSFPSLVEANVNFYFSDLAEYDDQNKVLVKIFENLSSVKLLKLFADTFLVLREADIQLNDSITLDNLTHLEVSSVLHYNSSESSILFRTLFKFMQRLPNLESILFPQSVKLTCVEDEDFWSLDPKCLPPHLKVIKFKNFEGHSMELNAIYLFLKYFHFLESLTIVASLMLYEDHLEQNSVMKKLLMFLKPPNCVVKFLTSSEDT